MVSDFMELTYRIHLYFYLSILPTIKMEPNVSYRNFLDNLPRSTLLTALKSVEQIT